MSADSRVCWQLKLLSAAVAACYKPPKLILSHCLSVSQTLYEHPKGFVQAIARHAKARHERHWHSGGSLFVGALAGMPIRCFTTHPVVLQTMLDTVWVLQWAWLHPALWACSCQPSHA